MKLSLKVQDPQQQHHQNQQKPPPAEGLPLLFRAKVPISIFNLPFLSGFSTTTHHPSDLSLSLATNFSSGPTLKLSYSTTSSSTSATTSTTPPLTLSLKSGVGVFGSPKNSPLIISANFSFSPQNSNPNPTFSLLIKPQLGSFSLRKNTSSNPNPGPNTNGRVNNEANSFGFVPLERPLSFKDFTIEDYGKSSIFRGISVLARTEMPVANRVLLNLRWGMNFPEDLGKRMPFLTVNKIGIERFDDVKDGKEAIEKKNDGITGDLELLRAMCGWMKREMDVLRKENVELKYLVEEMKPANVPMNGRGERDGKRAMPMVENSGGFEQWMNKKTGADNEKKEAKKSVNRANDVESELQKAIKAASSS